MKIKGFDENLCCRGAQFEIGGMYDTGAPDDKLEICTNTVYHYCDSPRGVHDYYSVSDTSNRFCKIEVLGAEVSEGNKLGSNRIRVVREITGDELSQLKGLTNGNTGLFNSGHWNSGDRNSGNRNSGDWNSGHWNSGAFNSTNGSNGFFCTKEPEVLIFNQPSGMTQRDFDRSKYRAALDSAPFALEEWIDYTAEEKAQDKHKAATEWYLKTYTYKEACENWWAKMTAKNRKTVLSIPNFDAAVFEEITGIRT